MSGPQQALLASAGTSGPATDPYFSSVKLLLHCDGTNGSTTFTDSSPAAKTVTANGNAQISTTNPKFGTGRCELDGANDYLSLVDSNDWNFDNNDFTVEMWIYPDTVASQQFLVSQFESSGGADSNSNFMLTLLASGQIQFVGYNIATPYVATSATGVVSASTWQHVALVRDGGTIRIYVGGVQVATTTISTVTLNNSTCPLLFGVRFTDLTFDYDGGYDDIRITKGVCRYPSGTTFTVPSAAFPDS